MHSTWTEGHKQTDGRTDKQSYVGKINSKKIWTNAGAGGRGREGDFVDVVVIVYNWFVSQKSHHDRQSSQSHSQKPNHSPSIQVSIQATSQPAIYPSIPTSIQIHLVCVIYFLHVFSDLRHRVDRMTAGFVYPDEAGDGNSPHSTATSHMLHETLSTTWFTEEWGMKSGISCIYTQYQRATLHGPRRGSLFSI